MPPTPSTGSSGYADGAAFVERFDYRTARQLLVDAEPGDTPLTRAQVVASERLAIHLAGASGEIEAAVLVGKRYQITDSRNDLADLEGNSAEYLKDIVCTLAAERLFRRRPDLLKEIGEDVKQAREAVEKLAQGHLTFGWVENMDAGVLDHHVETVADEVARNGLTIHARRLLGRRGWERQPGAGWYEDGRRW